MKATLLKGRIQVAADSTSETALLPTADIKKAARLWFEALRASSGQPLLVESVSPVNICPTATFDAVLRDLESANLLFTYRQGAGRYVLFHDPRQLRTFELLVPVPDVPQPDPFSALANFVTMETVLEMVGKEQGFSEEKKDHYLKALDLRTVGNLRVLGKESIGRLSARPVVVEYLQRVKAGITPAETCTNLISHFGKP